MFVKKRERIFSEEMGSSYRQSYGILRFLLEKVVYHPMLNFFICYKLKCSNITFGLYVVILSVPNI